MSNAWLKTFAALLSVATFAATPAFADPSGMALHGRKAGNLSLYSPASASARIAWTTSSSVTATMIY